jgi:outer membrane protein assembly factor BamB
MKHRARAFAFLLVIGLAARPADSSDWPGWRGADRTDVSTETGLLKSWPEGGPKALWIFKDCGAGYSGPAVVGKRLFIMGTRGAKEVLLSIDVEKGAELWKADIGDVLDNNWGDGPRGTPAVDGERVYAMGGKGALICAQSGDGKIVWSKRMQDLGGRTPGWGYSESVLVDGDRVLCTPGGRDGAIAALNKASGEVLWQSKDFTDGAQYSSIIAAEHQGVRQYVQLTMKSIVGLAAADGAVLWKSEWPGQTAVIPTPIFKDGHVYVSSGYGVGSKLVRLGPENKVEEVYFNRVMKNHHGGVILVGDHLYGYSDGVGWVCQDFKAGTMVWNEKRKLDKGAIACADGRLYCLEERSGTLVLVEASPQGWKEHGRYKLDPQTSIRRPQGRIWTHPVIANGRLYLRDQDLLFCLDVKAQ